MKNNLNKEPSKTGGNECKANLHVLRYALPIREDIPQALRAQYISRHVDKS
jgi:hypothetical protein